MPAEGGEPKRLTYTATLGRDDVSDRMGPNNIVHGLEDTTARSRLPLAHAQLQRLHRPALHRRPQGRPAAATAPAARRLRSFSPDGKKLAYNRIFREFRTWKRYRGGMADDIWIYDFETKKTENITQQPRAGHHPDVGADNKIYFLSDRDGQR